MAPREVPALIAAQRLLYGTGSRNMESATALARPESLYVFCAQRVVPESVSEHSVQLWRPLCQPLSKLLGGRDPEELQELVGNRLVLGI